MSPRDLSLPLSGPLAESLEPRRLLAVTLDAQLGILSITGGEEKNIVQIRASSDDDGDGVADGFEVIESTTTAASPPRSFPSQIQISDYLASGLDIQTSVFALPGINELRISGGGGDDLIILGGQLPIPAHVDAGDGNDSVSGGKGDDTIFGGAGDDYLFGGDRNDIIDGGTGADEVLGGAGLDTADFSMRESGVTVALDGAAGDGESGEGDNVRADVETVVGTESDDMLSAPTTPAAPGSPGVTFYALAGHDTLIGGAGDDRLFGDFGSDSISGGGGDDWLYAGEEGDTDTVDGGDGDDQAFGSGPAAIEGDTFTNVELVLAEREDSEDPPLAAGGTATLNADGVLSIVGTEDGDIVELRSGEDGLSLFVIERPGGAQGASEQFVSRFDIEAVDRLEIDLRGGDDVFFGADGAEDAQVDGGDGDDVLIGSHANDSFAAGPGDDVLFGRGGDDLLDGGAGADYFNGGGNDDTADYSGRTGDVTASVCYLPDDGERGERDFIHLETERIAGGAGNDRLSTIFDFSATLTGGAGDDLLTGGGGDDELDGGAGRDFLDGRGGNDLFFAQDGEADTVRGGAGEDSVLDEDDEDDIDLGEDQ